MTHLEIRSLGKKTMPPALASLVVPLTPTSLPPTVLPLLWLVNICVPSCGFCQALLPSWQALAKRLRHEVVVASWDAGEYPRLPEVLGVANATPTIRALVPNVAGDDEPPALVEYTGDRGVEDLARFAGALMPSLVVVVHDEAALAAAAAAARLPQLLCFVARRPTSATPPMLKALSTTFRGRLLVAEVRVHDSTPATVELAARFGVGQSPAFFALPAPRGSDKELRDDAPASLPRLYKGLPTLRRLVEFANTLVGEANTLAGEDADESAEPAPALANRTAIIPQTPQPVQPQRRDEL